MEALLHRLVLPADLEEFRQQLNKAERLLLKAEEAADPLEATAAATAMAAAATATQGGSFTQMMESAGVGVGLTECVGVNVMLPSEHLTSQ